MTPPREWGLASCKYGAECGLVVGCPDGCDCCLVDHACECEDEHEEDQDDDFDRNACPGCGGNCTVACR